jgi:hypothetical protein
MFQTNPFGQLVSSLSQRGLQAAARTQRYNPRPPGVLQPGGAPLEVLAFLAKNPDQWFAFDQLVMATGRTVKSIDFACIQLRRMDLIVTRENPASSRYLHYRFFDDGGQL